MRSNLKYNFMNENTIIWILQQQKISLLPYYSVVEAKEFIFEVFGMKFHPAFPDTERDECDDVCDCGIYPSHMYGRVGVQLMIDEGAPVSILIGLLDSITIEVICW